MFMFFELLLVVPKWIADAAYAHLPHAVAFPVTALGIIVYVTVVTYTVAVVLYNRNAPASRI